MKRKKAVLKTNQKPTEILNRSEEVIQVVDKSDKQKQIEKHKKVALLGQSKHTRDEISEAIGWQGQSSEAGLPLKSQNLKIKKDIVKTTVAIIFCIILLLTAKYLQIDLWLNKLI